MKVSINMNFVLVTHIFLFCYFMGKMIWCYRIMNVIQRTVVSVYKLIIFILHLTDSHFYVRKWLREAFNKNKLKSLKVAKWRIEVEMMNDEWWKMNDAMYHKWWVMNDKRWKLKDVKSYFKLFEGFGLWQTNERTDGRTNRHLRL